MDTIISDDIVPMLSDQLTAAQESAQIAQLAEFIKTSCDESNLDNPMEIVTPSATGQGSHIRWVYPPPRPQWEDIMGGVIDSIHWNQVIRDSQKNSDEIQFPFHLLPHSQSEEYFSSTYFDMSPLPDTNTLSDIFDPSCPPLFSDPFQFSEDLDLLMTPRSSSASTSTVASVPSAPKRPYRTSKALSKGEENGGMENGLVMEGLDMGIDFYELGDDYGCLNTPPRLLWKRSGSKDSARVGGDDQDNDPFL